MLLFVRTLYESMCAFYYVGQTVNSVNLYDEVLPGQPTIYAGSDDTYIYAVDMLSGKTKWRIKTQKDTG